MTCSAQLWDLAAGKTMAQLTNHKKGSRAWAGLGARAAVADERGGGAGIRSVVIHPKQFTFVSAAADNMKKWQVRLVPCARCARRRRAVT